MPKTGVLLVGLGGNNGSTFVSGVLANRLNMTWETKDGLHQPNYLGSLTQSATLKMGDSDSKEHFLPFKDVLPMLDPNDLVISGWDICKDNLRQATAKAKVIHVNLQKRLASHLEAIQPMPSIYYPDFIAANQGDRANNLIPGSKPCSYHLEALRRDIRDFKARHALSKVIVLWTANTERFVQNCTEAHETEAAFLRAVAQGHPEISPSQMFAMAAVLEGCAYINGSPQNTFVPAIVKAAERRGVFLAGDDFKSGQTKIKSVLVDFLVSAGIRPESIVSYNHLGNNDGRNLSSPPQFHSKCVSKSNVIDDLVSSNPALFEKRGAPDHCVVIKYVPFVGDSKRAMDEYTSSIFLNGRNTIVMHNTCEDSLLAAPLILDLILLTELLQRVWIMPLGDSSGKVKRRLESAGEDPAVVKLLGMSNRQQNGVKGVRVEGAELSAGGRKFERMHEVLSALSYLMKAPMVPEKTPVVNALFRQRVCIENLFRACLGLQPESHMLLEHKLH